MVLKRALFCYYVHYVFGLMQCVFLPHKHIHAHKPGMFCPREMLPMQQKSDKK